MPHCRWIALIALVVGVVILPQTALAATAPSSDPDDIVGTDGVVLSYAQSGDRVYLGGFFQKIGTISGAGAPVNLATNATLLPPDKIEGSVAAAAPDGSGGWYVGGDFFTVGTLERNNVAHILANGTVDPNFDPSTDNPVSSIVVQGGKVYLGGFFQDVNDGQPTQETRPGLAAFDATTGDVDPTFDAGLNGNVEALAFGNGKLYAGGQFTDVNGGTTRNRIAAFDTAGVVDPSFDPDVDGGVSALAVSGSDVYAGGGFTDVNGGGTARPFLAKFDGASGAVDAGFDAAPDDAVLDIAVSGSKLYLAGAFTVMNDGQASQVARDSIASVDAATGLVDPAFDPAIEGCGCGGSARTIAVTGGKVYAGGGFDTANAGAPTETPRDNVAAFDAVTGVVDPGFDPSPSGFEVGVVEPAGAQLFIGGDITVMGQTYRRANLAAISASTGAVDPTFDASIDGAVTSLTTSATRLYAGGAFFDVNDGQPTEEFRRSMASFDLATGEVDPGFDAGLDGCGCLQVNSMALSGSKLYFAGDFDTVNVGEPDEATRNLLAAVDASSGDVDAGFDPDLNDVPASIGVSDGKVYAVGDFDEVNGGVARFFAAAFATSNGAVDASFKPELNAPANTLALSGSKVYIGGFFDQVNMGAPTQAQRNLAAAFDGTTGVVDSAFNPNPGVSGPLGFVQSIVTDGTLTYLGGLFDTMNTGTATQATRTAVAAVDPATGVVEPTFKPEIDGFVGALFRSAPRLYASGAFFHVQNQFRPAFARFTSPPDPPGPPDNGGGGQNPVVQPPGGGSSPPIEPPKRKANLVIAGMKGTATSVSVLGLCSGSSCKGTVSLKTVKPYKTGKSKKKAKVDLGSTKFDLGPGLSKSIKIKLSKSTRAFIAKYKTVYARMTVTLDGSGTVTRRIVKLTAPKPKPKKK